ncbi:MAG: hypothetical protein IAX21_11350 [Candidatus Bathyarchaeota archaeon]|nr:MAG: hypothetical protein IAX21_11350 [Candidatus Bathyarchaeota archaeon]
MASTDKMLIIKSVLAGILVAVGIFFALIIVSNSWIKTVIISAIILSTITWLLTKARLKKYFKTIILAVMIFTIVFTGIEAYFLRNTGYPVNVMPSQPDVTVSYPNILNLSLTEIVQEIRKTPTFSFINFEHPGEIVFESISLDTTFLGGSIEVMFYQKSSNLNIRFMASNGHTYRTSISSWDGLPISQSFPASKTAEETLNEIDILGLNWFYTQAIEEYKNQTETALTIGALQISTQWENYQDYQGMTLLIIGYKTDDANNGEGVFFANFQPNGNLLYFNIANPEN